MKKSILLTLAAAMSVASVANASQASDATVAVLGHNTGATPFINNVDVTVVPPTNLKSIQFTVAPKTGSVTRPLSATYAVPYLENRGRFNAATGAATVPVFGLYAAFDNSVEITFAFEDGSSKKTTAAITTAAYDDGGCGYNDPTVLQERTKSKVLSYDFMLVSNQCNKNSPAILDTDGAIRWVGTADVQNATATFYDNAVYQSEGPRLFRIEMDGEVNLIADYTDDGVVELHHNLEPGKRGMMIEVDTPQQVESVNLEINPLTGEILDRWDFAKIIGDAIVAGGEDPGDPNDPSAFIRTAKGRFDPGAPEDWWHNNSTTYRRSDDTFIVSSRENFVIGVNYETKTIKWILGNKSKRWHQFASLRAFELEVAPGTLAPTGQHALSIAKADNNLLLFDNGEPSLHQTPAGPQRFSAPRKYEIDAEAMTAQAIWRYENDQSVHSNFCSSVYEDVPNHYVVDYAVIAVNPFGASQSQIFGLTPDEQVAFKYQYPQPGPCQEAYRTLPIHLEDTHFPTTGIHLANISARAFVDTGDNAAVAGFIISGNAQKPVVIRGLGPSLKSNGVPLNGSLDDPTLTLYNSNGDEIETNASYKDGSDAETAKLAQVNLTPTDDREAAIVRTLAPGAYTAILRGQGTNNTGIGLVEVYDIEQSNGSKLANLSTRAYISGGDNVLIGGVLLRGNAIKRVLFRGIGPELQDAGVENALADTHLEAFDGNGTPIVSNDDWQGASRAAEIDESGLAPTNDKEAAILMPMVTGNYTVIMTGNGANGIGLLEAYQLED